MSRPRSTLADAIRESFYDDRGELMVWVVLADGIRAKLNRKEAAQYKALNKRYKELEHQRAKDRTALRERKRTSGRPNKR